MRKNFPVTGREYVLAPHETIVSKTDLKGRITYVNADFIRISGFTTEELIGKAHNIVRHPDMPPAAYEDLWRNMKAGRSWSGLVKNRCKNGDHYWVEATASPILEDGAVTGFTSVRVAPSREQVLAAEAAYQNINAGAPFDVRDGMVVARRRWAPWRLVQRHSLAFGLGAVNAVALAALGLMAWLPGARWVILPAAAFLAGAGSCWLYRRWHAPLGALFRGIEAMSSGDLAHNLALPPEAGFDELGQRLRILQVNMKLLVGQIKETTGVLQGAVGEMVQSNQHLSARTEAQASSLEETAASMLQISSTVDQNAHSAHTASDEVAQAASNARVGGDVVAELIGTMQRVREHAATMADIISLIDDIAFQTNILALNASVEAARAGPQGRGFAVVAAEVRTLAQRAAASAGEIRSLIRTSSESVEAGSDLVRRAGDMTGDLIAAIEHSAQLMASIRTGSREQSDALGQIGQAVREMDTITQANAQAVEASVEHARRVQDQARHMGHLVGRFRLTA